MPARARSLRVELVRAYGPCTVPNESIIDDRTMNACGPVQPLSPNYRFGGEGHGMVQIRMGGGLGNFVRLHIGLRDVRETSGNTKVSNVTFKLRYTLRVTTNFCSAGDVCTTTEITRQLVTRPCVNGRCRKTATIDLGGFLTPGFDASIEIGQIKVLDPDGSVFAVQGIGRHTSEE